MPYTVPVRLDEDSVRAAVEQMWRWIDHQLIKPPIFRYRMTATEVALRLDFRTPNDAVAFADAFDGAVLGLAPAG